MKKKELTLSGNQCRNILRGETVIVKDKGIFNLIKDDEGDLIELNDGSFQREGTGYCVEKESNTKYEFSYTETGNREDDLQCYCSGFLTEVKTKIK